MKGVQSCLEGKRGQLEVQEVEACEKMDVPGKKWMAACAQLWGKEKLE